MIRGYGGRQILTRQKLTIVRGIVRGMPGGISGVLLGPGGILGVLSGGISAGGGDKLLGRGMGEGGS